MDVETVPVAEFPREVWEVILQYVGINGLLQPVCKAWIILGQKDGHMKLGDWLERQCSMNEMKYPYVRDYTKYPKAIRNLPLKWEFYRAYQPINHLRHYYSLNDTPNSQPKLRQTFMSFIFNGAVTILDWTLYRGLISPSVDLIIDTIQNDHFFCGDTPLKRVLIGKDIIASQSLSEFTPSKRMHSCILGTQDDCPDLKQFRELFDDYRLAFIHVSEESGWRGEDVVKFFQTIITWKSMADSNKMTLECSIISYAADALLLWRQHCLSRINRLEKWKVLAQDNYTLLHHHQMDCCVIDKVKELLSLGIYVVHFQTSSLHCPHITTHKQRAFFRFILPMSYWKHLKKYQLLGVILKSTAQRHVLFDNEIIPSWASRLYDNDMEQLLREHNLDKMPAILGLVFMDSVDFTCERPDAYIYDRMIESMQSYYASTNK